MSRHAAAHVSELGNAPLVFRERVRLQAACERTLATVQPPRHTYTRPRDVRDIVELCAVIV
jgi:hypothetical protein